jgi:hypothetical protein
MEGMDTTGIHMVEVEGKDMVEERPSKWCSEVEGMDMVGIHMVEDITAEVERVEREYEGMVLGKHRTDGGAERN